VSNVRKVELGKEQLKTYDQPILSSRGEEVAFFNLGSTVVLAFEAPELEFDVVAGQKVQMGQSLAHFKE
jgi:phosphatidylserine decarboxylase